MSLSSRHGSQGSGWLSRLGIGAQVALSAALALAAVLLVNWVAARPGLRHRFDLTSAGRNTLATATQGTLAKLPDGVRIEILYQPEEPPLTNIADELMTRTQARLALIEDEAGGKIKVEVADLSDRESWRARALELRIQGFENGLLVSRGEQRTFVGLLGGLAQVNIGNPARGLAPSVAAFTAEEAIVEALLDVTRGDRLDAYFTFGFGELDVKDDEDGYQAGLLGETLEREGFRVHRWNLAEDGPLPEDCQVLGILAPTQAWPDDMRRAVDDYLARGGRAVIAVAPDAEEMRRSDVPALVEPRGLQVSEGTLMRFVLDPASGKPYDGADECEMLAIPPTGLAAHPMLQPFRLAGRGLLFVRSHQVRVGSQPPDGLAQVIAWLPNNVQAPVWLDSPPIDRRLDVDAETYGIVQAGVMATSQLPPTAEVATPLALTAELETRIALVGTSTVFMNQASKYNTDLWRAAFAWVTDRDHRVNVSPRDPDLRFLPRDKPEALGKVVRVAQLWLPLGALLIGLVIAFLRARGGPKTAARAAAEQGGRA
ncbi:MAG: GldG family protein [Planctomycetota bacterium]